MLPVSLLFFVPLLAVSPVPDFRLQQEIQPIICTSTTVQLSQSASGASTCDESYVPIVEEIIASNGQLILRGKYDSLRAKSFRVMLFGQWYTLGQSRYLTATGNDWTLNLSHLYSQTKSGTYVVTLEMLTKDSHFYQDAVTTELTIRVTDNTAIDAPPALLPDTPIDKPRPSTNKGDLADTGLGLPFVIGLAMVLVVIGGILLRLQGKY
ncbi:hypothetical protein FJZ39_01625 [Candidatus Saccharibacteria bacterium]|nr:hypothetical protein [Candidatus Saccharibacteria bacterium]